MTKDIKGKIKLRLVPRSSVEAIARARMFGVSKYGDEMSYLKTESKEFLDASLRHIFKYLDGELYDEESGLCHLDHAITSLALAIDCIKKFK